jgi:hypothetical protein
VLAVGTPEHLATVESSFTGSFLREILPAKTPTQRKKRPAKVLATT